VKEHRFLTPGVPLPVDRFTHFKWDYFSIGFNLVAIADYDTFSQDADSIKQAGEQRDQWDDRSVRFMLSGAIGPESYRVHYFASYEWNGFDAPQNKKKSWDFSDLTLTFPAGKLGAITVGRTKEPFVYEMVGDATFLQQQERVLNPFFTPRNVGISLSNHAFNKRMTFSAGWFNDWWVHGLKFSGTSNHFASRLTELVSTNKAGSRYLHLAASGRYVGAANGVVRLEGRPESAVASYYVDTGNIPAVNQKEVGLEGLWTHDAYQITTEYVRSWVNASRVANPSFDGFYIIGSWVITGEHRPYDRNVGYARRVIPQHRLGAFELTARYSRLDLDDKSIHGGLLDKGTLGVNWYVNRFWKLGVDGGIVNLDRANLNGQTSMVQARIQFFY